MYSYKEEMKKDVRNWIEENHEPGESIELEMDYDTVFDGCWCDDSVTGNGSGSYTFSRAQAREYIFEDEDTDTWISGMVSDGWISAEDIGKMIADSDWERLDVTIRCWLLGSVIDEVLSEMEF